jgi:hypothetical protein
MAGVKTYDPKKVIITLGPTVITGYAKDTFVKAGRIADTVTSEAGASGEVARALNADHRGTIELTLMQTSISNDFLSAQAVIDENTGAGALPFLMTDLRGTTILSARNAWVKKYADSEFGQGLSNRAWSIETDELEIFVGGILPAS